MAELITMPRLSDTMEEGTVIKWHKKLGDAISEGDLLVEIETDKAIQEFESEYNGYLLHIGIPEGKSAKIDSILAVIGPQNLDIHPLLASKEKKKNIDSFEKNADYVSSLLPETYPDQKADIQSPSTEVRTRIYASPLAKKIAQEKSIPLSSIQGSGEKCRILKRDLDEYESHSNKIHDMKRSKNATSLLEVPSVSKSLTLKTQEVVHSSMRKIIAKNLMQSKLTAPHYYLTIEVDMKNAMLSKDVINQHLQNNIKISFNDLIIKAAAMALKSHPHINTSWQADKIIFYENIHIGVAVSVDDGLLVPVITSADKKSLREISSEIKDKAHRARLRKIQKEEMENSTFTISNLGMFGIETFTSIIHQPNSCILSVGAILEKPVVKNHQIIPGNLMKLSLACDHRVVDGSTGSAYLCDLKKILENPIIMLS